MKISLSFGDTDMKYYRQRRIYDPKKGRPRIFEEPCSDFQMMLDLAIQRQKIKENDMLRNLSNGQTGRQ